MTLEYHRTYTKLTACPFCGEALADYSRKAVHVSNCEDAQGALQS